MSPMMFRRTRRDDGAAAVEFALVAPLLIMLVFGIIEFGISFAQQLSLSNGARQGARFGAVGYFGAGASATLATCGDVVQQVQSAASTIGLNVSNVSVQVQIVHPDGSVVAPPVCDWTTGTSSPATACTGTNPGDAVRVNAKYQGHLTIPLVFYNPSFTLTGNGVYRCEYH